MRVSRWILPLIAAPWFTACRQSGPGTTAALTLADSADQILVGTQNNLTNSRGLKRGRMMADTAYVLHDATVFTFRALRITFTSDSGLPIGTLAADRGTLLQTRGILNLLGNVTLSSPGGRVAHGVAGRYSTETNEIVLDSGATVGAVGSERHVGTVTSDPTMQHMTCTPAPGC